MTREEELIRLLVRESIKEELELNELLGMNLFGKKDQAEVVPGTELNLTPQQAKTQLDNHLSGKIKINDPNRLKKVQDIVNKNFPQQNQQQTQQSRLSNRSAFQRDRAEAQADGWFGENKKRRKAALR